MHVNLSLSVAGLLVGFLVGLTGMGGGALLTPLLVLFFRVEPLAAISSDLLTSLVMKPVGGAVHLRQRTVDWRLVGWLTAGSVPSAFAGAVLIGVIGHRAGVQDNLKLVIGVALCASVAMMVVRQLLDRRNRRRDAAAGRPVDVEQPTVVRPLRTVAIGVVGGFAVGMTSVGAGSVIIALLLLAYPTLRPAKLVGTDIVQAIPLVAAATLGHLIFGDVQFALTAALLLGALPGVYLGARLSARGPAALIRPVVAGVLLASALALLKVSTPVIIAGAVVGFVVLVLLAPRRRAAEPTTPTTPELDPVH
ncbi:MAG: uncharacterized protein QOG57_5571 [Pseudonocardiales bacterium]|nr:uncharacterized protein [Pseudonocardiales bacterium]MDT7685261.1 uncharacterized protein [Pseudonocardiales bacterium]